MIQIKAPDGSLVRFPDGTSDATIQAVMAKNYGGPKPAIVNGIPRMLPPSPPMQKAVADARAEQAKAGYSGGAIAPFNGYTFNFLPEVIGAGAALRTGFKNLIGQGPGYGMSDAYEASRDVAGGTLKNFAKAHPIANAAENLGGAVVNPVNLVAGEYVGGAGSLPAAMARGGVTGGAIGATYGAGGAGPGHRGEGAMRGGVTGAALGAATPPLAAGMGYMTRKTVGAAKDVVNGARTLLNPPDPEAAASAADTSAAVDQAMALLKAKGLQPSDLASADRFGKGMTTAEAMGRPGVSSLGALGRRAGATPDELEAILRARAQGAPSRILGDFADVAGIHPEDAQGDVEGMVSRLRGEADPLFEAVRNHPGPVWSADLAKIAERPVVKKAIGAAAEDLLNAGKDPTAVGLQLDPDTGAFVLNPDLSKATDRFPTAETWDLIRQRIGDQVERHPITQRILPDSVSRGNYNINLAKAHLTDILAGDPANGQPGLIPGYRAALDKAGDYLSLNSAFQRGQDSFLNPNVSAKTFSETFGSLNEPEQKAWTAGVAAKLNDQLQRGRLTPKQLMLPHVQGKLAAVLGDEGLANLLPRIEAEAQLAQTGSRMSPGVNSPTMEFINAAQEQDQGLGLGDLGKALHKPGDALAKLLEAGRSLGTSPQVRNELGRILMQPPQVSAEQLSNVPPPLDVPYIPRLPYGAFPALAGTYAGNPK